MTDDVDRYEQTLDAFGADLARAARAPRRTARRVRLLTLGAGISSVAAGVVFLGGSDAPGPVSVVARAEAALARPNELLIVRTQIRAVASDRLDAPEVAAPCLNKGATTLWVLEQPRRWRLRTPPERCDQLTDDAGRPVTGPVERSWADGTTTTYRPADGVLEIVHGYPATSSANRPPEVFPGLGGLTLGNDALPSIRDLLRTGELRDAGEQRLHGHPVRVLTRTTRHSDRRSSGSWSLQYAVDTKTFVPRAVLSTIERRIPPTGPAQRWSTRTEILSFERRPNDRAARELLTVRPTGSPVVVERTLDEIRREHRRRRSAMRHGHAGRK